MIAKLIGIVDMIEDDNFILLCNGVGYQIFTAKNVLLNMQEKQEFSCHIQTIVKEDAIALYGFHMLEDKKLFNLIITVPGVGPKIALLLIGSYSVNEIVTAIINNNINLFRSISGIGLKVAQRIITELKDKVKKLTVSSEYAPMHSLSKENNIHSKSEERSEFQDAIDALTQLGYTQIEVEKALDNLQPDLTKQTTSDIIKELLKFFASNLK